MTWDFFCAFCPCIIHLHTCPQPGTRRLDIDSSPLVYPGCTGGRTTGMQARISVILQHDPGDTTATDAQYTIPRT